MRLLLGLLFAGILSAQTWTFPEPREAAVTVESSTVVTIEHFNKKIIELQEQIRKLQEELEILKLNSIGKASLKPNCWNFEGYTLCDNQPIYYYDGMEVPLTQDGGRAWDGINRYCVRDSFGNLNCHTTPSYSIEVHPFGGELSVR